MAEACPHTNEPCVLDERLQVLKESIPQSDRSVLNGLVTILDALRQRGGCTGELQERGVRVARLCNHDKITEINNITYNVGGNMTWPSRSYTGIGVIWKKETKD